MINEFQGEYRFLSNFYSCPIEFESLHYDSTEAAYQSAKTTDRDLRREFSKLPPGPAKRFGKGIKIRPDWDLIKLDVMYVLLKEKFAIPSLREKLLATGEEELVEGNNWNDQFWGVCNSKGENHLGKLLMKVRTEIRNETNN